MSHLLIVNVSGRLNLEVTGKSLEAVVDHEPVHPELQRHHEDKQHIREHHRTGRQPGPSRLAPEVSPGESEYEVQDQPPVLQVAWVAKTGEGESGIRNIGLILDRMDLNLSPFVGRFDLVHTLSERDSAATHFGNL